MRSIEPGCVWRRQAAMQLGVSAAAIQAASQCRIYVGSVSYDISEEQVEQVTPSTPMHASACRRMLVHAKACASTSATAGPRMCSTLAKLP